MQVGTIAINDGIILESCIYRVLRSHFKSTAYYTDVLDLFHEVSCIAVVVNHITGHHSVSDRHAVACNADVTQLCIQS